jgi:hypothetical protein
MYEAVTMPNAAARPMRLLANQFKCKRWNTCTASTTHVTVYAHRGMQAVRCHGRCEQRKGVLTMLRSTQFEASECTHKQLDNDRTLLSLLDSWKKSKTSVTYTHPRCLRHANSMQIPTKLAGNCLPRHVSQVRSQVLVAMLEQLLHRAIYKNPSSEVTKHHVCRSSCPTRKGARPGHVSVYKVECDLQLTMYVHTWSHLNKNPDQLPPNLRARGTLWSPARMVTSGVHQPTQPHTSQQALRSSAARGAHSCDTVQGTPINRL